MTDAIYGLQLNQADADVPMNGKACKDGVPSKECNMRRSLMLGNLLSALVGVLSAASPALSQQPPPAEKGSDPVNETRELESEIEQYPGPNDGVVTEELDTRIPEQIQRTPKNPSLGPTPAPMTEPGSPRAQVAGIDPKEIQRVFGQDALVLDLDTLTSAQVTRLQTRLRELGHYLGVIDGIIGPKTRAALSAVIADQFALSQRLLQQNQLTTELATQVGLGAATPSPAKPVEPTTPSSPPSP